MTLAQGRVHTKIQTGFSQKLLGHSEPLLKVKVISLPCIFQVMYVLCFTRPRYQVSVYRTIGPLVIISSPEPLGSQGELIVYQSSRRLSVRRRRKQFQTSSSPKTAWPIKAKFYVEHPWVGGMIFCSRNQGHMTKMAATPIYGKNPSKIFFSRTVGPISTKLGM